MEKIFIVGAGAIGKALAVFLTLQKKPVVLLRASVDSSAGTEDPIEIELADGSTVKTSVSISSINHFQSLEGIIILTNKAFGNTDIASKLKGKLGQSPIVVLQNGLNVEEPFLNDFSGVYRCVLFATSQVISPDKVRFKPVSVSPVGIIKGDRSELDRIVEHIDSVYFKFGATDAIQTVIWKKVIANCVFNSICPLIDADNGIFHKNSEALNLAKLVTAECSAIARTRGIDLKENEIIETILMISKSSDGQLISTLQDIRNGRQTEIDNLNSAIVKIAEKLNLSHLVQTTDMLGRLIRLKSIPG